MLSRRRLTILIYGLALMALLLSILGVEFYRMIYRPIPLRNEAVILRVDKSTTASSLLRMMHAQGWIGSIPLWTGWVKIQGLSSQLKAGIYQIQPGESAQHLLLRIVAGDVLRERFFIRPGSRLAEVQKDLSVAPYLDYQASDWSIILGDHASAEGLLLADTYVYAAGSTGQALIRQAHLHLEEILQKAWATRQADLPYQTPYELLIAASILEKEAAIPEERRLISSVIVNRIKKNMPLQMDPTVIYALGEQYKKPLTHADLATDSPYNTYLHRGLPPTPIAMVSADAIDAASHPLPSTYLYFVAKGDGSHIFNTRYDAHRAAIKQYMDKTR